MNSNQRSRGWCFTINNPREEDDVELAIVRQMASYLIVAREIGICGTHHYQGFARFNSQISFKRIRSLLPRAHVEPQRGSSAQAAEYCRKDGNFTETGEIPVEKRNPKERWAFILRHARTGEMQKIEDEYPGEFIRYYDKLIGLRTRIPRILDELQNEWWCGPTGTGKSRQVWALYPEHYGKQINKWWDGYSDEETVVIEEWSPKNEMSASNLKIWADRYPFNAEIKGGTLRKIRPTRIIITSNYTMEQCFERREDLEPLLRRFKVVNFFNFFC